MCVSTNYSYDSPREMSRLKLAFVPSPPRKENRVSAQVVSAILSNLDYLSCPFGFSGSDGEPSASVGPSSTTSPSVTALQLTMRSKPNKHIVQALDRMGQRPEAAPSNPNPDASKELPRRVSRLLLSASNHGSSKTSKVDNDSPRLPLGRGLTRSHSGHALCA